MILTKIIVKPALIVKIIIIIAGMIVIIIITSLVLLIYHVWTKYGKNQNYLPLYKLKT